MGDVFSGGKTLPMSVANTGFMLDRLGEDCAPLQYLRELTQNAIEAILDTGEQRGDVVWDVDWNRHTLTSQYKLCIVDTGTGMTGDEMVLYINQLSSSIREQSLDGNYGVGAKIAAATRNHAGLLYLSWKDGVGSMIHLWRDPSTGTYGLRQFEWPDGSFDHYVRIEDDIKPEQIDNHGTMVVLLGNDEDQNTIKAPEGVASPSRWVQRYLNTRYFRFPEGVTLKARIGWEQPRSNTDVNILATVTGQKAYLDQHSETAGVVELSNASAHWWILRDENALTQNSGYIASSGHIAALHRHELYEMMTGRAGVARLQLFGVIFGYNRVVIYVEPHLDADHRIRPNTARTNLLMNNEPPPWTEWAEEFRRNLPEAITSLMEAVGGSSATNYKHNIKERLKHMRDLFKVSRYRPTPNGDVLLAEDDSVTGGRAADSGTKKKGNRNSDGHGGRAGDVYALFIARDGLPGTEVHPHVPEPEVRWVTKLDGTRAQDFMEDRAADFKLELNLLTINADFRVFTDFTERWHKQYEAIPGAREVVEQVVHEWFEQQLVEAVMGAQLLRGSREWSLEDIKGSLSQEALTAVVMPRYHIEMAARRALGSRLGALKEKAS